MRNPLFLFAILTLVLPGCSLNGNLKDTFKDSLRNPLELIQPYKLDIPQGNVITQEMVDKLKPGMTRSQVRFVLGTPLVVDAFRTNRWDFVYTLQKGGKTLESRRVTILFDGDVLQTIEGNVVAAKPAVEVKP
ncbi:MAG: outer membrane protein assembly factor BamE [Betaproteobacteria bacterium]|nr:outer membrane protein assembly factor BamE [Betaproteobacteria bacterium]